MRPLVFAICIIGCSGGGGVAQPPQLQHHAIDEPALAPAQPLSDAGERPSTDAGWGPVSINLGFDGDYMEPAWVCKSAGDCSAKFGSRPSDWACFDGQCLVRGDPDDALIEEFPP